METENKMSPEQSLEVIQQMIASAKSEVKASGFLFLLWGWLVFIVSISQFIMVTVVPVDHSGRIWWLMVVGGVVSIMHSVKKEKRERIKTYIGDFMRNIWIAFGSAMFVVMFFAGATKITLPVIIILYGIGLFLSGGALKFKPLMFGGFFCWICAAVAFKVQNEYILLILALAVLGGYIIPGHLLNAKK